jgi:hypothetical protein
MLNPTAYVTTEIEDHSLVVRPSPAHDDQAWIFLCGPNWVDPLQAAVRVLDPHLDVEAASTKDGGWSVGVVRRDEPAAEAEEVSVAKLSTGTDFSFETRRALPITPV